MVENAAQSKTGIMINAGVNAKIRKTITCPKKIIFEIILNAFVKIVNL